jgi:hypothetical protein
MNNDWIFESTFIPHIQATMSNGDVTEFQCDPKVLEWDTWSKCFYHGIKKFIFRQESISPLANLGNIVSKA